MLALVTRSGWLLALATVGCAPRAPARTLGAGHAEVAASLGGPVFSNLGPALPLPLLDVGGRYGITDEVDVLAHVHMTAALYRVAGIDLGGTYQLARRESMAVAATARASIFFDGTALRAYPELAAIADWRMSERWSLIYGVTGLAQFSPPRGKPPVLVALSLGAEVAVGGGALALDLAWISPWQDATSVIDWQPGQGALAVRLGYRRGVR